MLETSLSQNVRLAAGFNDTRDWSVREYLHLQLSPRLTTSLGAEAGYSEISNAPDMFYVQLLGSVVWHPVELFSFQLETGFENRSIRRKNASDLHNPILGASIEYRPVETTTISLTANRTTSNSYFSNQVVENSNIGLGLRQRLLGALLSQRQRCLSKTQSFATRVPSQLRIAKTKVGRSTPNSKPLFSVG